MPVSQIIGPISWWLHASPALVGLCVVAYLLWTVATRERRINSQSMTKPLPIITFVSRTWKGAIRKGKDKLGAAKVERVWVTGVVMVASVLIVYASTRPPKYPITTEHHVLVLVHLGDGDWLMQSDEQGQFAYRPCNDFNVDPMFTQAIGYVAPVAKWEERGDCKSIRATGLGFWWRDRDGNYIKADGGQ